ncbi:hypothetical protein [Streptomyces sp. Da 82-17]|uniref:hypothetical protein n=1 Tax=Streptomyces sp. Da 82-17 TaxID=3377116 RepID=UPI0038D39033
MTWFLGLGMAGVVLLALSLVLDGLLDGFLGGVLDGLLDGWLSLPVIAGFTSMLGFAGALTLGTTGLGPVAATAVGTGAGVVTAYGVWRAGRALLRGSGDSPRGADLVGSAGRVVTPIPADGYGEVLLQLAGQPVKLAARSDGPMARGAEVWVERTLSATSVAVRPVEH